MSQKYAYLGIMKPQFVTTADTQHVG